MTPTSPLAGLVMGLVDGLIVTGVVFVVVVLTARRHRTAPVVHGVADDAADQGGAASDRAPLAPPR